MRNNKRKAVFGMDPEYYANPRLIDRSNRLRIGNRVVIRTDRYWDDWVRKELTGKIGTVIDNHPYGWDVLVRFTGTKRVGGIFAFWSTQVIKVK